MAEPPIRRHDARSSRPGPAKLYHTRMDERIQQGMATQLGVWRAQLAAGDQRVCIFLVDPGASTDMIWSKIGG